MNQQTCFTHRQTHADNSSHCKNTVPKQGSYVVIPDNTSVKKCARLVISSANSLFPFTCRIRTLCNMPGTPPKWKIIEMQVTELVNVQVFLSSSLQLR